MTSDCRTRHARNRRNFSVDRRACHYTHVLCVALHRLLHRLDDLDMRRSFEHRLGGKATIQRWVAVLAPIRY